MLISLKENTPWRVANLYLPPLPGRCPSLCFSGRPTLMRGRGDELLMYHCSSLICTWTKCLLTVLSTIAVLNITNYMHIYRKGCHYSTSQASDLQPKVSQQWFLPSTDTVLLDHCTISSEKSYLISIVLRLPKNINKEQCFEQSY